MKNKFCIGTPTMMTDLYQLTMMQGLFVNNMHKDKSVFDMYFRPGEVNRYCVFAGLEQIVEYIQAIKFEKEDIEYLSSLGIFKQEFLQALSSFKFEGDIDSVVEGEIVFAQTPLLRVTAPLWQAQFIETALLNISAYQSLVASRACRMTYAAGNSEVIEFGLRRSHASSAGLYASRASYIGGVQSTSNVYAGQAFGMPVKGTMAHSWVQSFDSELNAFEAYADAYPDSCMLLIDTYNTLNSGLPNAIKVFDKLKQKGHKPIGIRIDSGDFAYLSNEVRKVLDKAGHQDAIILVSGDVDEQTINTLNSQGAKIDAWGIGGKLVTGHPNPIFGMVYKLAAVEKDGKMLPKFKISNTTQKTSDPGAKKFFRIYTNDNKAFADLIVLQDETLDTPLVLTHQVDRYKTTILQEYTARNMHTKIFKDGKLVYKLPTIEQSNAYCKSELSRFWAEYLRDEKPQLYKVNLSDKLFELKQQMILGNRDIKKMKKQ